MKPTYEVGTQRSIYDGQEIVFFACAKVGGAKAIRENPSELIQYNLELASRNIKAAAEAGVQKFGYISSSYCYPDLGPNHSCKEEDTALGDVPDIHYGLGWIKRYIETLLRHYHMTTQMRAAIVRPAAIYGPNDDFDLETCHVIPALIRKFLEGPFPVELWGDGNEWRQFTFVDDLADGLLAAVENYAVCQPINIASTEIEQVRYAAAKVRALIYGNVEPKIAQYRFTGKGPTAIASRLINVDKAKRELKIECKTNLDEGLTQTIEWARKNLSLNISDSSATRSK
jgi:nucleoside-diphosphate-sugar epimerase